MRSEEEIKKIASELAKILDSPDDYNPWVCETCADYLTAILWVLEEFDAIALVEEPLPDKSKGGDMRG